MYNSSHFLSFNSKFGRILKKSYANLPSYCRSSQIYIMYILNIITPKKEDKWTCVTLVLKPFWHGKTHNQNNFEPVNYGRHDIGCREEANSIVLIKEHSIKLTSKGLL